MNVNLRNSAKKYRKGNFRTKKYVENKIEWRWKTVTWRKIKYPAWVRKTKTLVKYKGSLMGFGTISHLTWERKWDKKYKWENNGQKLPQSLEKHSSLYIQ